MAFVARFLTFGTLFIHYHLLSECRQEIRTFTYHRSDVTKSGSAMVPTNVLSNKTLLGCAVISSMASETSFYFRERTMECIVEKQENNYLSGPFESEFIRFVTERKGLSRSTYTVDIGSRSAFVNPGDKYVAHCNISKSSRNEPLELYERLMVTWSHNGANERCRYRERKPPWKYHCKSSEYTNHTMFQIKVLDVQKADEGNLTCGVYESVKENGKWVIHQVVAKKYVTIQVRDQQIMALDTMSSQPPQTKVLTKEDHDEDILNSIPVPKLILENPFPDFEMSYTKAKEKKQSSTMATLPKNRKKSLADELLEKTKGLLEPTNVLP